jgi:hypothetical protein
MPTFKYNDPDPIEIGGEFPARLSQGQTIEVPEGTSLEAQLDADPRFTSSRVKNPDVTTGPIPVQATVEPAPAA